MAMTKKEVYTEAEALIAQHNTPEAFNIALLALLAVKTGGGSFNVDDVAVLDEEGKPVFILDSKFNKWVPVVDHDGEDLFYVKPDTTLGYSRWARLSESVIKAADKVFKATKDGVFKDLMAGGIDQPAAQKLMEQAEKIKADVTIPESLCALDEKPELSAIKAVHANMKKLADELAATEAEEAEDDIEDTEDTEA